MHFTVEIFEGKRQAYIEKLVYFYFILAGGIFAVLMIHNDFAFMKAVL